MTYTNKERRLSRHARGQGCTQAGKDVCHDLWTKKVSGKAKTIVGRAFCQSLSDGAPSSIAHSSQGIVHGRDETGGTWEADKMGLPLQARGPQRRTHAILKIRY